MYIYIYIYIYTYVHTIRVQIQIYLEKSIQLLCGFVLRFEFLIEKCLAKRSYFSKALIPSKTIHLKK